MKLAINAPRFLQKVCAYLPAIHDVSTEQQALSSAVSSAIVTSLLIKLLANNNCWNFSATEGFKLKTLKLSGHPRGSLSILSIRQTLKSSDQIRNVGF